MALLITQNVGLLLKSNNDIDFTTRRMAFAKGLDGVVQGARTRMYLVRGELFYNLDRGVPYFARDGVPRATALFGQKFSVVRARAAFRPAILATPGVLAIKSMRVDFAGDTRTLAVTWRATTIWGDTEEDTLSRELGAAA